MKVYDCILTRRSTRSFLEEMPEEDSLNMIVEAGRHAPSGGNSQSTHFFVIKDAGVLEKLAELVEDGAVDEADDEGTAVQPEDFYGEYHPEPDRDPESGKCIEVCAEMAWWAGIGRITACGGV